MREEISEALGTLQNLLYDMAGGDEKFLQKDLFACMQLLQKNQTAQSPFPFVSASNSLSAAVK